MMYRMDSRLSSYGREIDAHDSETRRSIDALTNAITMLSSRLDRLESPSKRPSTSTSSRLTPRTTVRPSTTTAQPRLRPSTGSTSSKANLGSSFASSGSTRKLSSGSLRLSSNRASTGNLHSQRNLKGSQKKVSDRQMLSISRPAATKTSTRALLSSRRRPTN